jgi:hypothetical protein
MARRSPLTMTDRPTKKTYLERDLYNDLRWLLCAATDWHIQNTVNEHLDSNGQGIPAYHAQVYMVDSVALHARALFEFLTKKATSNRYGVNNYLGGLNVVESDRYRNSWEGPLHAYLMHLQPRPGTRAKLSARANARRKLHLNRMSMEFTEEIIELWRKFTKELGDNGDSLAAVADRVLTKAIADSRSVRTNVVTQHILRTQLPAGFSIRTLSWE